MPNSKVGAAGREMPVSLSSRRLVLVCVLLTVFLTGFRSQVDPAHDWIARCLAAHGGEAALRRVQTVVWKGEIRAIGNRRGSTLILLNRPLQLRTRLDYAGSREDRLLNGHQGWRDSGAGFVRVSGPPLAAMIFQYRHLTLPLGLLDKGVAVSWAGTVEDGVLHPRLRVNRAGEPELLVDIDPDSGLIKSVTGRFLIGNRVTELAVAYGDYRQVEGVELPTTIVNFAGGMKIARSQFPSVTVNADLPPATFALPGSGGGG
jgi:hypothetical protein